MRHLKRSLLFVPLLTVFALAFASTAYAHASPLDHGGVTAASVRAAARAMSTPLAIDHAAPWVATAASIDQRAVEGLSGGGVTARVRALVYFDTGDQRLATDLAINHYGDRGGEWTVEATGAKVRSAA